VFDETVSHKREADSQNPKMIFTSEFSVAMLQEDMSRNNYSGRGLIEEISCVAVSPPLYEFEGTKKIPCR
jgi:hypothetical protein